MSNRTRGISVIISVIGSLAIILGGFALLHSAEKKKNA